MSASSSSQGATSIKRCDLTIDRRLRSFFLDSAPVFFQHFCKEDENVVYSELVVAENETNTLLGSADPSQGRRTFNSIVAACTCLTEENLLQPA